MSPSLTSTVMGGYCSHSLERHVKYANKSLQPVKKIPSVFKSTLCFLMCMSMCMQVPSCYRFVKCISLKWAIYSLFATVSMCQNGSYSHHIKLSHAHSRNGHERVVTHERHEEPISGRYIQSDAHIGRHKLEFSLVDRQYLKYIFTNTSTEREPCVPILEQ